MFLALEIIEEGPLAHVRGFGDVFHRDVGEAALGDELKRAPEQPHPRLRGAPLAASHAAGMGRRPGAVGSGVPGWAILLTFAHDRLTDIIDLWSYNRTEFLICQEVF